ncbi:MAG: hypothetical protein IPM69_08710 [Ignavibacteria bacterium]|nr:hypothetical protein [Ignavibacteria bacterium]
MKPNNPGITVFNNIPLETLREFIDWTPFFMSWELRGKYPAIFNDTTVGAEALRIFDDANVILDKIIHDNSLAAKAVCGIFPANRVGDDDVELHCDSGQVMLYFLRQQSQKSPGTPNLCLADFIAPKEYGEDYIGAFAVTAGIGLEHIVRVFEADHDDYSAIMAKAIADRLAEAAAEWLHFKVRTELWGYATTETLNNQGLIDEEYQGIRPAPGYPACPDHTEKKTLFALLDVENNAGIWLTENYAMYPAAAVSGWYFAHPQSKYFPIGKIGRDQVKDYARRKGMSIEEVERWLSPNLGYEV